MDYNLFNFKSTPEIVDDCAHLSLGMQNGVFIVNDPQTIEKDEFILKHNLESLLQSYPNTIFKGKIIEDTLHIYEIYDTLLQECKDQQTIKAIIDNILEVDNSIPLTYD